MSVFTLFWRPPCKQWLAAQTILGTIGSLKVCACSGHLLLCSLSLVDAFRFSSTRRDALTRGTQSCRFTLRGCFQLRVPRRRQSLRHDAECRANVCWFVFACGLCVHLTFFSVFDYFSHSYVRRSLPQIARTLDSLPRSTTATSPFCA